MHQDEVSILSIYVSNIKKTAYVKETLVKLKPHIKPKTLIVRVFKIPLSLMDKPTWQKLNREIRDLTDVMTLMDLIGIYRPFHPNTKEYTYISASQQLSLKLTTYSVIK